MKFETWLNLVYIDPKITIRNTASKHQAKIKEIWDAMDEKNMAKLLEIQPIDCTKNTNYVAYCRYLLHCLDILKNEGLEDDN